MTRLAAIALAIAGGAFAVALGLAALWLAGCGGESAPPATPILPPVTTAPAAAPTLARLAPIAPIAAADERDAGREESRVPQLLRSASFGPGSVKPEDRQVFRLLASLVALRASPSGATILGLLSSLPSIDRARAVTGVDPIADGEWLLVYGPEGLFPGSNVTVLGHTKAEAEVSRALAGDGGLDGVDGGAGRAFVSDLFGVREVLLQRPGLLALVPPDRAADVSPLLGPRMATGVKKGELASMRFAERPRMPGLPLDVENIGGVVKAAPDDGLDVEVEGDCRTAALCTASAAAIEDQLKARNTVGVRLVTANILGAIVVRASGKKLRVTVHASPNQVAALMNLLGLLTP